MSEAQVADNKKPADATPAAEKPAAAAATDTASASTKLLDACGNKPAETKAEASSTAADTTAKESAPAVKEDHVDTLLRGDQNKDGDDEDDKTTNCQREYLDSVKQGAKPAEAQNTAKLPDLAIKEEQVKDLPKDSKQVGGDEKSGYKVFEGPDGKRYFQKGNGQFTVLELSADGKRFEGTSDHGHKKVVMDKNSNDAEAVKVFDDKGKQVEIFEHKKDGGGNMFSRGWNAFKGAVNDYVVKPATYVADAVSKTAVDIFSDDKWDFSADTKDLVQPPAPPDDYKWLNDIDLKDDDYFWNKDYSAEADKGFKWDDEIWNKFDPAVDPKKDNKVFSGTDGTEVVKGADGKYTLKHNGKDIELQEENGPPNQWGKPSKSYVATLENGQKAVYSDRNGDVTIGESRIARSDTSTQINDLPPGAKKMDLGREAEQGRDGGRMKFDVYEGPDGTRYFKNKDGGYTTMAVSADGKHWEGRLKNGDKVLMDKDDPKHKFKIYDNEGELKVTIGHNGDIERHWDRFNQRQRYSNHEAPRSSEDIGRLEQGVHEFRHDGKVTKINKQGDSWMKVTTGADGLEQVAIRFEGREFARDSKGNWVSAESGQKVPADVVGKLNEFTQKGMGAVSMRVDMRTGESTHQFYETQVQREEAQQAAAENRPPQTTPFAEGTTTLKQSELVDHQRHERETVTEKSYQVVDSETAEALYGVDREKNQFHSGDGNGPDDYTLGDDGFWDASGAGMDAEGNIYDEDGHCVWDQGFADSNSVAREQEYQRSEAVGEAEMGKASSMISPARGVIYGAFDPATAESLCSAAYAGLSGAINLAMSCGNTAMAGELMSKQSEAATWISVSANARKATTQRAHEIPGGGGGMGFLMAQAARDSASGVGSTTAFNKMMAIADPTNPRVAHLTGYNPISLTWTEGRGDNNNRAA